MKTRECVHLDIAS